MQRFPLRIDLFWRGPLSLMWLRPSQCYVEWLGGEIEVRMGWAFRARFPRNAVSSARREERLVLSRGIHGMFGRWLVNGSGQGLVKLTLEPQQKARMLGFPVALRELTVSVEDPDGLIRALS